MLACHGGITIPPWLSALVVVTALAWLGSILVAIPNLMMSARLDKSPAHTTKNLVFFAVYLVCGLSMIGGTIFNLSLVAGIVLIFLTPLMTLGHFLYLIRQVMRERKKIKAAAGPIQSGDAASPRRDAAQ